MALINENGDKINEKRNVLDAIAEKTKERIEKEKKMLPLEEIKKKALSLDVKNDFPFEKALKKDDMAFICEVKKASPSKGIIAEDFDPLQIAKDYEKAGADAISCLTEPFYFKGQDEYLVEIAKNVKIPVLRKDFTIDEYMIYQAKIMGASAILLICAILDDKTLQNYFDIAESLGLSVLVEAHTTEEITSALKIGARIIGVNNRNLKNFHVDLNNSINLRKLVSNDIIFVSESGIKTAEDIKLLANNNTNAVLIGETLMRSDNKKRILDDLRG
ncbi:MAG: indole-3-glycerol phosphate synthase TrpC [Clostridia bacterium]